MESVDQLEHEVRELVRRRGIDPVRDRALLRALVGETLDDYDDRALRGHVPPLADRDATGKALEDAVGGLGPLQAYLDDPSVEEIWINAPDQVFVARGGEPELTTTILEEPQVRDLVEQMLKVSGRRLDLSSPFVDAALPGGERLHVVIPDVTRAHWAVNIRKYLVRASHLDDLVALGSLTPAAARFLSAAVVAGLNVLVSGPTQAGKTTMLNALAGSIPPRERVISAEEVFELAVAGILHICTHPPVIRPGARFTNHSPDRPGTPLTSPNPAEETSVQDDRRGPSRYVLPMLMVAGLILAALALVGSGALGT